MPRLTQGDLSAFFKRPAAQRSAAPSVEGLATPAAAPLPLPIPPPAHLNLPVPQVHINLNHEQKEAVEFSSGLLSVIAGPGSGKTRVIASRVDFLRDNLRVPPWAIVVLTFSNKAATELSNRLGGRVKEGVKVGTFHGFAMYALASEGCRLKTIEAAAQMAIVRELLRTEGAEGREGTGVTSSSEGFGSMVSAKRRRSDDDGGDEAVAEMEGDGDGDGRPGGVKAVCEAIMRCKLDEARGSVSADDRIRRLTERYKAVLQARGAIDFDDMLIRLLLLLRDPEAGRRLRHKYRHVLVVRFACAPRPPIRAPFRSLF